MNTASDNLSYTKLMTDAQLEQLRRFAAEFDHIITLDDLLFPILIVSWQDKWIGYVKIMNNLIGFTAWHPKLDVPPRVFKKAFDELVAWAKIQATLSGQVFPGFVAKGDDSSIPDSVLNCSGLTDTGFRLFKIER